MTIKEYKRKERKYKQKHIFKEVKKKSFQFRCGNIQL